MPSAAAPSADRDCCGCSGAQGIDLKAGGRSKKVARTAPKSENVYLALLVKVRGAAAPPCSQAPRGCGARAESMPLTVCSSTASW